MSDVNRSSGNMPRIKPVADQDESVQNLGPQFQGCSVGNQNTLKKDDDAKHHGNK
jgi:hypothetical protein